uniref:Saposin B-type domain-containing protein n=1 Tax=Mola mola TaxID=94237 RepID=A0A3Q3W9M4_MOLML
MYIYNLQCVRNITLFCNLLFCSVFKPSLHLQLLGVCWLCQWALNKVKKRIGANVTVESLKSKVSSICNEAGFLKSKCRKFVARHLGEFIEELTTTDDVRTICINAKDLDQVFNLDDEDSQSDMIVYVQRGVQGS